MLWWGTSARDCALVVIADDIVDRIYISVFIINFGGALRQNVNNNAQNIGLHQGRDESHVGTKFRDS